MKNGEIMTIEGQRVMWLSNIDDCKRCVFSFERNRGACPDCGDGAFFEAPPLWSTGKPTKEGKYVVACLTPSGDWVYLTLRWNGDKWEDLYNDYDNTYHVPMAWIEPFCFGMDVKESE